MSTFILQVQHQIGAAVFFFCCGIINNSMNWINKDFKKDWENTSPENKRHVIKLIIILGALTLVPVICIACSMATGAMWLNEP
jgi:hypothetical protein